LCCGLRGATVREAQGKIIEAITFEGENRMVNMRVNLIFRVRLTWALIRGTK
jgi:hypothetical protein